jgi:hypothetical protein
MCLERSVEAQRGKYTFNLRFDIHPVALSIHSTYTQIAKPALLTYEIHIQLTFLHTADCSKPTLGTNTPHQAYIRHTRR